MECKQNELFVYQAVLSGDLEILRDGTIWRVRKRGWDRWKQKAVSRPCKRVRAERKGGKDGSYFQVGLMMDGVRVFALAHRLVYLHLKGPIPDGLTVNHEDGQKKRNHPDNLTLATYSEQQIHATRILKVGHACDQAGEKNSMATLTREQVIEVRARRSVGEKLNPIAEDFGIAFQTVSKIARFERWAG
jgi:hypothetical protein